MVLTYSLRMMARFKRVAENVMSFPTIEIEGKKVVLLSGYQRSPQIGSARVKPGAIEVEDLQRLLQSANENPDAVAFGYTSGRWVPAA
jgi:hypothetical protein